MIAVTTLTGKIASQGATLQWSHANQTDSRQEISMTERTSGTMARASKGPMAPPPLLDGAMATVAETVASWPGVVATAHWDLYDSSRVDGIDFYVGEDELGHIHLDGSIHLATNPSLGKSLIAERLAERFPYARGWVQRRIEDGDTTTAIGLFKRNYERFAPAAQTA